MHYHVSGIHSLGDHGVRLRAECSSFSSVLMMYVTFAWRSSTETGWLLWSTHLPSHGWLMGQFSNPLISPEALSSFKGLKQIAIREKGLASRIAERVQKGMLPHMKNRFPAENSLSHVLHMTSTVRVLPSSWLCSRSELVIQQVAGMLWGLSYYAFPSRWSEWDGFGPRRAG